MDRPSYRDAAAHKKKRIRLTSFWRPTHWRMHGRSENRMWPRVIMSFHSCKQRSSGSIDMDYSTSSRKNPSSRSFFWTKPPCFTPSPIASPNRILRGAFCKQPSIYWMVSVELTGNLCFGCRSCYYLSAGRAIKLSHVFPRIGLWNCHCLLNLRKLQKKCDGCF